MHSTPETTIRELDRRHSDGIDVGLLWNARTNRVWIAVEDGRLGESLTFEVDGAEAPAAFHHPHAYANHRHTEAGNSRRELLPGWRAR